jgi:hypothetical protein
MTIGSYSREYDKAEYFADPTLGQNLKIQGLGSPLLNDGYIKEIQKLGEKAVGEEYNGIKLSTTASTKERFFELLYLVACNGNAKGYRDNNFNPTDAMKNKKFANLMGELKYSKDVMTIKAANASLTAIEDDEWEELVKSEKIAESGGLLTKLHSLNILSVVQKNYYEIAIEDGANAGRLEEVVKTLSNLLKEKRTSRNIIKYLDSISERSYGRRGVGRVVKALFSVSVSPFVFIGKIPASAKFLFNKTTGGINWFLFEVRLPGDNPELQKDSKILENKALALVAATSRNDENEMERLENEIAEIGERIIKTKKVIDKFRNKITKQNNKLFKKIDNGRLTTSNLGSAYNGNINGLNLPFWHTNVKQGKNRDMIVLEKDFIKISKLFAAKNYMVGYANDQDYITKLEEIYDNAKNLKN